MAATMQSLRGGAFTDVHFSAAHVHDVMVDHPSVIFLSTIERYRRCGIPVIKTFMLDN